jgi:hypothetical protein
MTSSDHQMMRRALRLRSPQAKVRPSREPQGQGPKFATKSSIDTEFRL